MTAAAPATPAASTSRDRDTQTRLRRIDIRDAAIRDRDSRHSSRLLATRDDPPAADTGAWPRPETASLPRM